MKTYRIRYTHDNRVKSVHETEEPEDNTSAWWVIVGGLVVFIAWMLLW